MAQHAATMAQRVAIAHAATPPSATIEITLPFALAGASTLPGLAAETISRRIRALRRAGVVRKTEARAAHMSCNPNLRIKSDSCCLTDLGELGDCGKVTRSMPGKSSGGK